MMYDALSAVLQHIQTFRIRLVICGADIKIGNRSWDSNDKIRNIDSFLLWVCRLSNCNPVRLLEYLKASLRVLYLQRMDSWHCPILQSLLHMASCQKFRPKGSWVKLDGALFLHLLYQVMSIIKAPMPPILAPQLIIKCQTKRKRLACFPNTAKSCSNPRLLTVAWALCTAFIDLLVSLDDGNIGSPCYPKVDHWEINFMADLYLVPFVCWQWMAAIIWKTGQAALNIPSCKRCYCAAEDNSFTKTELTLQDCFHWIPHEIQHPFSLLWPWERRWKFNLEIACKQPWHESWGNQT